MASYENLNIEIIDGLAWLRDGEQQLMGYENIDHLINELNGIIKIDDDFKIVLLDEEKLHSALIFL